MNQVDMETCIDRPIISPHWYLKPKDISKDRKRDQSSKLDQNQLDSLRTVICQSGWITGQTRLELAFEICMISSYYKNTTANEIIQANTILEKARRENIFLRICLKDNIK